LAFRSYEQDQTSAGGDLSEVLFSPQETADRLADVNNVDQIAASIDIWPHFGVPTARSMAEMDSRLN
jgi:hypothetical protein